jgi:hypothetical protein
MEEQLNCASVSATVTVTDQLAVDPTSYPVTVHLHWQGVRSTTTSDGTTHDTFGTWMQHRTLPGRWPPGHRHRFSFRWHGRLRTLPGTRATLQDASGGFEFTRHGPP